MAEPFAVTSSLDYRLPVALSLYQLKPRFQALLRPLASRLAGLGVTANMVTVAAMLLSVALGAILIFVPSPRLFLLVPGWMLLRMACNAIDGMLAREYHQRSVLGAYLNELSDVISDTALYIPFAMVAPFGWASVGLVVWLAMLSEMAGAIGPMVGASRRYDGPMGKSDRALVFALLGLYLGVAGSLPTWSFWLLPLVAVLIAGNICNRVRAGVREVAAR